MEAGEETHPPQPRSREPDDSERKWAMGAHLSGFAGLLGIPFGNILGPLIVWMLKKEEMPFAADQAKEALNFQISFTIYGLVAALSILVFIGVLILPILAVAWIVLMIKAGIMSRDGNRYRYPYVFRLVD